MISTDPTGVTVAQLRTVAVTVPIRDELVVRGARGAHDRSDFLLVEVVTSTGVHGYGEVSATPLWSGEDAVSATHFIDSRLRPLLIGAPLFPVAGIEAAMDRALAANPFTKAGVSIALWDAAAGCLGVPLSVLLGGPTRTEIPIKMSLSGDGAALDTSFEAAAGLGIGAFKVKVGVGGIRADLARVLRARDLVGKETLLGVDANGGWSRAEAMSIIGELAALGVAFVEQPLAPDDLDGMRQLRGRGVPIMADESVFGRADLVRVLQANAADLVSLYVGKAGGPGRAVEQARLAAAFGVDVVIGSNGEMGIGAAAQAHVAAAITNLAPHINSDIIGALYYQRDILATPLDSDGRRVLVPTGTGLGVVPAERTLAGLA